MGQPSDIDVCLDFGKALDKVLIEAMAWREYS